MITANRVGVSFHPGNQDPCRVPRGTGRDDEGEVRP